MEELTELPVIIERASDFLDRRPPIYRDDICFFMSQTGKLYHWILGYCYAINYIAITYQEQWHNG